MNDHASASAEPYEPRYSQALERAGVGYWDWDAVAGEFYASPCLLRIVGAAPHTSFANCDDFLSRLPVVQEDLSIFSSYATQHAAGVTDHDEIEVRITSHNTMRWVRLSSTFIQSASGKVQRWEGLVTDVTDWRQTEEALRASQERFALAVKGSADGPWDWNLISGEMFFSERAQVIYGLIPGETVRPRSEWRSLVELHPDDVADQWRMIEDYLAERCETYDGEWRVKHLDGSYKWVRIRGICVRDSSGTPVRMAGSVSDINTRKRGEEALRRTETYLAESLRLGGAGSFAFDVETNKYIHWSPELNAIWGFDPSHGIPGADELWARAHPDDVADVLAKRSHAVRDGHNYDATYRVIRTDGSIRHVHVVGRTGQNPDTKATELVGIVVDVTEATIAAGKLRDSEERFALAVEATNEGIFDWDLTRDRIFASIRAQEMCGLPPGATWRSRDEWAQAPIQIANEDRERVLQALADHFKGEAPTLLVEFRIRDSANSLTWLRLRALGKRNSSNAVVRLSGSLEDITERKLAAAALVESESRFRGLAELSTDWFWEQDEHFRFTYLSLNSLQYEVRGVPGNSWVGKTRWELSDVTPLSCTWEEHRAILDAHEPFREFEYSRPGEDGQTIYISVTGVPVFDDEHRFKGYQGAARLITERKSFEERLRTSEARYARAVEATEDGVWEWNPVSDRVYLSARARQLMNIPEDIDLVTRADLMKHSRVDQKDRGQFQTSFRANLENPSAGFEFEFRVKGENGGVRWIRSRGKFFPDLEGNNGLVTGSLTDVTERKGYEEELRSRQEMLDLAQAAAHAVAFDWSLDSSKSKNRWSRELEELHGLSPGEFLGTAAAWKQLVHPEDWSALQLALSKAIHTGDVAADYRVTLKDGSDRWLQAKGRIIFDGQRPVRMLGFVLDVTDRRAAEDELRRLESQLSQALRLEAMGTLAGGIAHDFNNILGAILGYGEMAMRDAAPGTRLRRDLDSIVAAGERGRALIERILAFSRSGMSERVSVYVEKVVREALDLLSARLPDGVILDSQLQAGRAAMRGDPTQIHQVVMNLVTNGLQAMGSGGRIHVSLTTKNFDKARSALVGAVSLGEYIVLTVSDTGSGIPDEVLDRIFDPFFSTKEVGGTGLGLSLVHGIVTGVEGAIDVLTSSEGTTFTVFFPRDGDASEEAVAEAVDMPLGNDQRVLVVDDEEPLVRLATEILAGLGYIPEGYISSVAALEAFRADPMRFDALVTDERMPTLSGSDLIIEVRKVRRDIPILLLSGFVGGSLIERAEAFGVTEVLQKPLSARSFAASLSRVLQTSAASAS